MCSEFVYDVCHAYCRASNICVTYVRGGKLPGIVMDSYIHTYIHTIHTSLTVWGVCTVQHLYNLKYTISYLCFIFDIIRCLRSVWYIWRVGSFICYRINVISVILLFLWVLAPCGFLDGGKRFGETYCLHLQGCENLRSHGTVTCHLTGRFVFPF
jgi:hypothetical protein